MLFNSYVFLAVFLPAVLAGFFVLPRQTARIAFLVAASYVFYAYDTWWFPALLIAYVGNSVYGGAAQAWGPDGTLYLPTELSSNPSGRPRFVDENIDHYRGTKWSASVQGDIVQAVALAHAHGWRVVGFSPPYASDSYDLLAHDPRYATLWSMFVHRAPQLFARYGYPFLDLSDGRKLSACTDDTFVFQDGARIPARPARCRSGGPSMRRPPSCRRRGSASPS